MSPNPTMPGPNGLPVPRPLDMPVGDPNAGGPQRAGNFPAQESLADAGAHAAATLPNGLVPSPGFGDNFGRQPIFHGNTLTRFAHKQNPALGQQSQFTHRNFSALLNALGVG